MFSVVAAIVVGLVRRMEEKILHHLASSKYCNNHDGGYIRWCQISSSTVKEFVPEHYSLAPKQHNAAHKNSRSCGRASDGPLTPPSLATQLTQCSQSFPAFPGFTKLQASSVSVFTQLQHVEHVQADGQFWQGAAVNICITTTTTSATTDY